VATVIHANDGRTAYVDVITKLRLFGVSRPSRVGPTRDLGHTTIVLDEPFNALPLGVGRHLSNRIAALEAIQLIGAFSDPEWLVERAPQLSPYREPSGAFWGAYGRRIGWQIHDVVTKLLADPWTRQAVATLWDPGRDNLPEKRDYPCTVALGFTMQPAFTKEVLDMHVTMRSNDAWLGLPYDMFQFTQLQQTVCRMIDVRPGTYTHTAWSMHLYDRDVDKTYAIALSPESDDYRIDPTGLGEPNMSFTEVGNRAQTIALEPEKIDWELTPSERWYRNAIHGS
jgi:Thymidylate synthase